MNYIDKLTQLFTRFPGIGARQAKRFVFFLLSQDLSFTEDLAKQILSLKKTTDVCLGCYKFFFEEEIKKNICSICSNAKRQESLMVLSRDIDLENIEKSGTFNGRYFILGGTIPILEKVPKSKIRIDRLLEQVEKIAKQNILKEVIIAMDFNPEGENTTEYLKKELLPIIQKYNINISTLGKGLSLGTELEYSDPETIKNSLLNRS